MLSISYLGQFQTNTGTNTNTGCPSGTHYDSIEQQCVTDRTLAPTTLTRQATLIKPPSDGVQMLPGAEAMPGTQPAQDACGPQPGPATGIRWECRSGQWKALRIAPYVWSPGNPAFGVPPTCHDIALGRIVADSFCLNAGLPKPEQPSSTLPLPPQTQEQFPGQTPAVEETTIVVPTAYEAEAEAAAVPVYRRAWFWLVIAAAAGGGTYAVLRRR